MRERSAEEKIKDLHEARELVKDKNIDGISWRHAEALEEIGDAVALLKNSIAI